MIWAQADCDKRAKPHEVKRICRPGGPRMRLDGWSPCSGVFPFGDARSLNFDADVKKRTSRHQCEKRFYCSQGIQCLQRWVQDSSNWGVLGPLDQGSRSSAQ